MLCEFKLLFDERDDGTKVWSAKCRKCDKVIVGELGPSVVVIEADQNLTASMFENLKARVNVAWNKARMTGSPLVVSGVVLKSVIDHGDLQRALETHWRTCGKVISEVEPATSDR